MTRQALPPIIHTVKKIVVIILLCALPLISISEERNFKKEIEQYREALKKSPKNPELLFKLAQFLSWNGEFDESIKIYRDLIDDNPQHIDALLGLAGVLSWKKLYDESIKINKRVLELDPQNVQAHLNIGKVYFWKGDLENSRNYYQLVLKLDRENFEATQGLTQIKEVQTKYPTQYIEKDLDALLKILKEKPNDKDLRIALAQKYIVQKEYKQALVHLEKAHELEPQDLDTVLLLGRIYSWDGQYDKSLKYFDLALKMSPENFLALIGKGRVYSWSSRYQEAIGVFQNLLKKNPDNQEVLIALGRVYSWDKQYEKSIQTYKKILDKNPKDIEALKGLANTYKWSKQYAKGIATEQKIITYYPREVESMLSMGYMYLESGALDKAIFWYEKAAVAEPQRSDIYAFLGILYSYSARIDDAATSLKKSIELQEGNISSYVALGRVYSWQAKIEESKKLYERALKIDPNNIEAINGYAQVHYFDGQWDKAIELYEKSLKLKPKNVEALEGLKNVKRAKAPTFVSRYNNLYTKDYDLGIGVNRLRLEYDTEQFAEEFAYRWAPHLSLEGRYEHTISKRDDLFLVVHDYNVGQHTTSVRGEVPLTKNAYIIGRIEWNEFYNRFTPVSFRIFKQRHKWTGFSLFRFEKNQFDFIASMAREASAVLYPTGEYILTDADTFGGSLTFDASEYFSFISSYFYTNYAPIASLDRQDARGIVNYKLPFLKKMELGYEHEILTNPAQRVDRFTIRYQDRFFQKLLMDLSLQHVRDKHTTNSGLTKSVDFRGVLSLEVFSSLYLTGDFNYIVEQGIDRDYTWNTRFSITYLMDFLQ